MNRFPSFFLTLVVPAVAAFVLYLPALSGGFLSDDYGLLHAFYGLDREQLIARVAGMFSSGVGPPSNQYRPLTMASFALNAAVGGADPSAWRMTNVLLHAANAALVSLLALLLAEEPSRSARFSALAAGLAFAWFPPGVEAVAWIAARFDAMALFWMLIAACAFVRSSTWRDRFGLLSLASTALAFMSKESAVIGVALIVGLAWARRMEREGVFRAAVGALVVALPWIAIAAAYFILRARIFGDPFRFFPGSSPAAALLTGEWLAPLLAIADWWPLALPETSPRHAFDLAALLLLVCALASCFGNPAFGRVLAAVTLVVAASFVLLLSHWRWPSNGEGGRVLYSIAAVAAMAAALPLRAARYRLRITAWAVCMALIASEFALARAAVERRAAAGTEVRALIAALAQAADATPSGSYTFVIVPDHLGPIPFGRNAQGGLVLPPVQPRALSPQLIVQTAEELPRWPDLFERDIIGRLEREPLASVTANPLTPKVSPPHLSPDRYFCWSPRTHALVALPIAFEPGFRDWDAVWARALDAAGCRG